MEGHIKIKGIQFKGKRKEKKEVMKITPAYYFELTNKKFCEERKERIPNFIIFMEKRLTSKLHIELIYIYTHGTHNTVRQ